MAATLQALSSRAGPIAVGSGKLRQRATTPAPPPRSSTTARVAHAPPPPAPAAPSSGSGSGPAPAKKEAVKQSVNRPIKNVSAPMRLRGAPQRPASTQIRRPKASRARRAADACRPARHNANAHPCWAAAAQVEEVRFRTVPLLEEVYPNSSKVHTEVVHQRTGEVLKVRLRVSTMTDGGRSAPCFHKSGLWQCFWCRSQVPFRRVQLTNGKHLDLYDTSGPQGFHPRQGLPKLRQPWIERRYANPPQGGTTQVRAPPLVRCPPRVAPSLGPSPRPGGDRPCLPCRWRWPARASSARRWRSWRPGSAWTPSSSAARCAPLPFLGLAMQHQRTAPALLRRDAPRPGGAWARHHPRQQAPH